MASSVGEVRFALHTWSQGGRRGDGEARGLMHVVQGSQWPTQDAAEEYFRDLSARVDAAGSYHFVRYEIHSVETVVARTVRGPRRQRGAA